MGVPQKSKTSKKCAKGKKSCKAGKKSAPMWGGSPASAMLFDDIANPTNPDNYLDADIPLVANQTSVKSPMTGGSLASAAVVGAVNTQHEPGAMLNDYESAMDLKGCGGKAVMTGGSIASNRVTSLVNLPGVLKPEEVTRTVPDYLSTEPRPDNYNLTGGAINYQGPLQRQFAMAPEEQHGQVVGPEGQVLVEQPGEEWNGDWNHPPANQPKPKRGSKKVSKRRSTSRTVQPKSKASKRTSKRHIMTVGGDRPLGLGPVPRNREELRNRWADQRAEAARQGPEAEQRRQRIIAERRRIAQIHQAPIHARANIAQAQAEVAGHEQDRPRKRKSSSGRRSSGKHSKKQMTGGASGFWGGVAGCGPVNVPNAGNTLSKFFTKSSSCPGPDFYANPPGLGSAGSGYETELPSGAPFPFM